MDGGLRHAGEGALSSRHVLRGEERWEGIELVGGTVTIARGGWSGGLR